MDTASNTESPLGPAILGVLLHATASLPREPSTDVLLTQAFLQADGRALRSPEFRAGLAACLASMRHPGDEEARAQDAAQWEALLSNQWGGQLLIDARLTPEQRLANLSFFLLRPELPLGLLVPYAGNLTSIAAHEAQQALQAFPPEQVAPIARFPEALVSRFPEMEALPRPVDAQALSVLVPHVLRPDQAARFLQSLADEVHGAALEDSPVSASRRAFADYASSGLRELATRLEADTDPRQVAQVLVLGGLQHQAFFQNLTPFTENALAVHEQPVGTVSAVDGVAREVLSQSMSLMGMALGGAVGTAAAEMTFRSASRVVDALIAGGRLPLGALAGEVLGVPGLGLAPQALGELVAALTQLYAAQLAGLGDEAATLVEELMPLLLRGEVEGLDTAWTSLLENPERMEALRQAEDETRAEVLRMLLMGGAVGALSWEALAPALLAHTQTLFGHFLPADMPAAEAAQRFATSAARAVAVLANEGLFFRIRAGELSPTEALAEARELGASLFVGGTEPATDPGLTIAMLGALAPLADIEDAVDDDSDDALDETALDELDDEESA
jgi:nitroreductase